MKKYKWLKKGTRCLRLLYWSFWLQSDRDKYEKNHQIRFFYSLWYFIFNVVQYFGDFEFDCIASLQIHDFCSMDTSQAEVHLGAPVDRIRPLSDCFKNQDTEVI